jgi:hypothetical protein
MKSIISSFFAGILSMLSKISRVPIRKNNNISFESSSERNDLKSYQVVNIPPFLDEVLAVLNMQLFGEACLLLIKIFL